MTEPSCLGDRISHIPALQLSIWLYTGAVRAAVEDE